MKRALTLIFAGLFALTLVGCHADIEPNDSTGSSHYKKTTTYDNNGGTVTTETKTRSTD